MRSRLWFAAAVLACTLGVGGGTGAPPEGPAAPELVVEKGHIGVVTGLRFISRGRRLVSGSRDMTLKIWDVEDGREIRSLGPHRHWINALDVSPDESLLASASDDRTVRVWEIATGRSRHVLDKHAQQVKSVAFSADGKLLASGDEEGALRLWDVVSGDLLDLQVPAPGRAVNFLDFSPVDSSTLVAGLADGSVRVWKVAASKLSPHKNLPSQGRAQALRFSDDGRSLAAAGPSKTWSPGDFRSAHRIDVWDALAWRKVKELEGHGDEVNVLAFSPDGETLLSGSDDKTFALWDWRRGVRRWRSAPDAEVNSAAFAPEGGRLAVAGSQAVINIWGWRPPKPLSRFGVHSAMATAARYFVDAGILALSYADMNAWETTIRVVNTLTGEPAAKLKDESGLTVAVAVSLDGSLLASGGDGNVVSLYRLAERKGPHVLKGSDSRGVGAITFNADGSRVAAAYGDKKVYVWDTRTCEPVGQHDSPFETVASLSFDPDGRLLVGGLAGNALSVVDVVSGRQVFDAPAPDVEMAAFSLAGRRLAWVGADRRVHLLDAGSGARKELTPNLGHVVTLSFSEAGQHLVSSELDGSVRVWDVNSGREMFTFVSLDEQDWLAVTPEGFFDGTPGAWRRVLWRFGGDTFDYAPVEAFFDEFYRPGLLRDVMLGQSPKAAAGGLQARDRRQPAVSLDRLPAAAAGAARHTARLKVTVREAPAGYDRRSGKRMPPGGVRDVRLFRNGSLVRRWTGDLDAIAAQPGCTKVGPARGRSLSCVTEVSVVGGANDFTAYAFNNQNVKSEDSGLRVTPAGVGPRLGRLYVLAVGVDKYPVLPLQYAVCDAERLGSEVRERQARLSGRHPQYAETRVARLLDEHATRANILLALERLAIPARGALRRAALREAAGPAPPDPKLLRELGQLEQARPEDAVIIFFSGHGLTDADLFYLLPYGVSAAPAAAGPLATAQWLARVKEAALSTTDLEPVLADVDAGEVVMAIDACHSGQSLESEEARRGPLNSRGLAQLAYEKGMYILTASQGYEVAAERSDLRHGVLTYALLEGLRAAEANLNRDDAGLVTEREWMDYAVRRVGELQQGEYEPRGGLDKEEGCGPRAVADARVTRRGKGVPGDEDGGEQRPRVYYRREEPARPLIVSHVSP